MNKPIQGFGWFAVALLACGVMAAMVVIRFVMLLCGRGWYWEIRKT